MFTALKNMIKIAITIVKPHSWTKAHEMELRKKARMISKRKNTRVEEYVRIDGLKLRNLRNRLGYSSDDLAKVIGCSGSSIRNWERGYAPVHSANLRKLAQFFNKRTGYFRRGK